MVIWKNQLPLDSKDESFLRTLAPGQEPNLDIVAIHGLNPKSKSGHAEKTWESDGKLWLRDFLPRQLPQARILLYGYNSKVAIQSSSAGVREQAQNLLNRVCLARQDCRNRPILFIAHSLGGIIVKEALVQAKLGQAYHSIFTATFGIAFFGTPHRGSQLAGVGEIVARAIRGILGNPSNTFLNALKKDSFYNYELSSNFKQLIENYQYLNFYETLPLKSFGLIVDKNSAILGLPDTRETVIGLNANHEEICRFSSEDDEQYKYVSELIIGFANSATGVIQENFSFEGFDTSASTGEPESSYFAVPYPRNSGFINRKPILQELKDRIAPFGNARSRIALFGLGGVGKSQIAIEFAYQIHDNYPQTSVFWVHASSIDRFREGYYAIFNECGIPEVDNDCDKMSLVRDWLKKEHHDWVMIIDSADDASLFMSQTDSSRNEMKTSTSSTENLSILDYLPDCSHGSILVTTRNRAAGVKFAKSQAQNLVEVKPMTEEESKSLIKSTIPDHVFSESEIHELSDLLEHLPLAIVQATAFMQENMLTVGEYIDLYRQSDEAKMDLLCEPFETLGRDTRVPNAVATTLMVSMNQIKGRDIRAIEVLSFLALVNQHDIPKSLIQQMVKHPLELTKALGTLKAFSLIMLNEERERFSLHRLVQLVVRKWLAIENEFEDKAIQAMDIIAGSFPDAKFENWALCAAYLPHAQTVLQFLPELHGKLLRRRLYLQEGIAYYLWTQGYCGEAECLDLLILEENKREFGMEHPETLDSMASLSSTYTSQGRWSEAEELDLYLVETRKKLLGVSDSITLTSMSSLANTYQSQGRLKESEILLLEVLETRKLIFGEDHEDTIDAMANLGSLYYDWDRVYASNERLKEAEELTLCALNWRDRVYGPNHENTWMSESVLAQVYRDQGRLQEAEELTIRIIQKKDKALGPKHPGSRASKSILVGIYQKKGDLNKAEELLLQILEEMHQGGSTPYDLLATRRDLYTIYWDKGLIEEAESLEDELLRDSIRILGPNHLFTFKRMYRAAMTRKHQKKDAEAIQRMVHVVNQMEKNLGAFHEETLAAFGTLSDWCGVDEAINMCLDVEEQENKNNNLPGEKDEDDVHEAKNPEAHDSPEPVHCAKKNEKDIILIFKIIVFVLLLFLAFNFTMFVKDGNLMWRLSGERG